MSKQDHRGRPEDDLAYDARWAWREANHLALELHAGASVVYPVPADRRAERLERFGAIIDQLEARGLVLTPQVTVDGDELTVTLVPHDNQRAQWARAR